MSLAQLWGGGTLSSSDGQRFPVAVKNQQASALPKYFGYGKGVTFYTWTADQFSQFANKVIPATVRDATYVLDGILDNEIELNILEHSTDTAGYTEIIFALFDLLGLQFFPRIRDLATQQLYRLGRIPFSQLKSLFVDKVDQTIISSHWDDLLHIAASLKFGWVSASTDDLANQAACLTWLTNAIVSWNTVYLQKGLDYFHSQGQSLPESDTQSLSPARFYHLNPDGKFQFLLPAQPLPLGHQSLNIPE